MIIVWTPDPEDAERFLAPVLGGASVRYAFSGDNPEAGENDVLLACGASLYAKLAEKGVTTKKHGLKKARSTVYRTPRGVPLLCTYDPKSREHEVDKGEEVRWDAALALRLHSTGSLMPDVGEYSWATLGWVAARVRDLLRTSEDPATFVRVGLDLETMDLWPWYDDKHLLTSQWCWRTGEAVVVRHVRFDGDRVVPVESPTMVEDMRWLLNEPRVRLWGSNLKGDLHWIRRKLGVECTNFTFDTVLGGHLLDENRSNGLKAHARTYSTMGGYETDFLSKHDIGRMEVALRTDEKGFLGYAGADPDATMRTGKRIAQELGRDRRLNYFYKRVLHPAMRAMERAEYRGLVVDEPAFRTLHADLTKHLADCEEEALDALPAKVRAKHIEKLTLRPAVIADAFFSKIGFGLRPQMMTAGGKDGTKAKAPQTSLDHLRLFRAHEGAAAFLAPYERVSKAKKIQSTYVGKLDAEGRWRTGRSTGFMGHLRPDGLFHPVYAPFRGALFDDHDDEDSGSVTGRLAAKAPSVNTVPKHFTPRPGAVNWPKRLRQCYPAPPGYLVWQVDFSMGELRIVATIAPEPTMIAAFKDGIDLHALTAARTMDVDVMEFLRWKEDPAREDEYKLMRHRGKAQNFGLIYRQGAEGFQAYARDKYGVDYTISEAERIRDRFLYALYPGIPRYHDEVEEFVTKHGYVETPLGRLRRLPMVRSSIRRVVAEAVRQAINSRVQIGLNDIALLLWALVEEEFSAEEERCSVRGSGHDALYGYVREDCVDDSMQRINERALTLPGILSREFDFDLACDLPLDFEIGPTLGDLQEYKLVA